MNKEKIQKLKFHGKERNGYGNLSEGTLKVQENGSAENVRARNRYEQKYKKYIQLF